MSMTSRRAGVAGRVPRAAAAEQPHAHAARAAAGVCAAADKRSRPENNIRSDRLRRNRDPRRERLSVRDVSTYVGCTIIGNQRRAKKTRERNRELPTTRSPARNPSTCEVQEWRRIRRREVHVQTEGRCSEVRRRE